MTDQKNNASEFILKLIDMMSIYEQIVGWNEQKTEIVIKDVKKMTQLVLPKYFRHSKFESFVRQLNMYNFHKVCRQKNNTINFKNEIFFKGNEINYGKIRRKKKNQSKQIYTQLLDQNIQYITQSAFIPDKLKELIIILLNFKQLCLKKNKSSQYLMNSLIDEMKASKLKKFEPIINQIKIFQKQLNQKQQNIQILLKHLKDKDDINKTIQCQKVKQLLQPFQQTMNAYLQNTPIKNKIIQPVKIKIFQNMNLFKIHSFRSITSFIDIFNDMKNEVKQQQQNCNSVEEFSIQLNAQEEEQEQPQPQMPQIRINNKQ